MTAPGSLPDDPEASGRLLFATALLAGLVMRLFLLGRPDLFGPDEGIWAVAARNLVEGGAPQLFGLSAEPLGAPSGVPVFFPALLSVVVRVFGAQEWAIRLPSVFAGLLGAFLLERVVKRGYGQPAGHLAGAFAALFPPLVLASRAATVEPTLVALGLAGVIFGLRAFEEDHPGEGALAGLSFGLGFLAKGDAVFLFLGPLLVALLARPYLFSLGRTKRSLALLLGAFALTGGSHLLLSVVAGSGVPKPLLDSFFGVPGRGLYAASGTAFGADLKTVVGALFLFIPMAGLGVAHLLREVGEPEIASGATGGQRRLPHGVLWGVFGLQLLLVVAAAGKLSLSSIPVLPALAAFAGLGAALLLTPAAEPRTRRKEIGISVTAGAVTLATAGFLAALPSEPLFGGVRTPLVSGSALAAAAAAAAVGTVLVAGAGAERFGRRPATAFVCALLVAAGVESVGFVRRELLTHRTYAREVADQIAPLVARLSPRDLAFRAPDAPALSFLLFRTGRTWNGASSAAQVETEARGGTISCWAFRTDVPDGLSSPRREVKEWLADNAREVTADVSARAGRDVRMRVFVAEPSRLTAAP